jgi:hypothetical protein
MTDLRTAAQQALDAILDWRMTGGRNTKRLMPAYYSLRAALAEPQSTHSDDCWKWHHKCAIARIEETEELREALKAALAESEKLSEPVAWMHTNGVGHVYFRKKPQDKVFNPRPVYLKDE